MTDGKAMRIGDTHRNESLEVGFDPDSDFDFD